MTEMHQLERNWWEALADQYEEWAENPPRLWHGAERYTCSALTHSDFGWNSPRYEYSGSAMVLLWVWQYGITPNPAGYTEDEDRDERRFEFCWWQAETIREYLATGRGPWE